MYESLERRLLLSSVLKNGILTVGGGPAADAIAVTSDGTNLNITGIKGQASFPLASVQGLVVKGGGGKDTIDLSASPTGATILGGDGNDSVTGSDFNDFIDGQGGADLLMGGDGNDTLFAGVGADVMQGGGGSDVADYSKRASKLTITRGDGANDGGLRERDDVQADIERIVGGNKADKITGSSGADSIDGGGGNDTIDGGGGDDTINGGIGNDSLAGGEGDDVLNGGASGADTLDGGTGNDTADYSDRASNLSLSANDAADDGAAGEKDNISSDIDGPNMTGCTRQRRSISPALSFPSTEGAFLSPDDSRRSAARAVLSCKFKVLSCAASLRNLVASR